MKSMVVTSIPLEERCYKNSLVRKGFNMLNNNWEYSVILRHPFMTLIRRYEQNKSLQVFPKFQLIPIFSLKVMHD